MLGGRSTWSLDLMKLRHLIVLTVMPLLTACFPVHYLLRPGLSGSVVDDSTSMPVADATVILRHLGQTSGIVMTITTDKNGRFSLAERRAWGIYVVPEDVFDFLGTVDIYASGYIKISRDFHTKILGTTAPIDLGEIRLKRPP